ncbi:MAG: hypothetical protein JSV84_05270 [Gemmatimonadota bacterium]|nr:MAG: hypothetical protein JSV84_05270 [Gemmatimonadota bacterium]
MERTTICKGFATLMVFAVGLTALVLLSVGNRTAAQPGQPDFDEEFMRMMHPVELARQFVTDDKLPQQIAEFKWKLYREYQAKGFTEEQAFQLVLSGGIPFSASQ